MEIWKDILGYEGYYMISNLGRFKSLDRLVNTCGGGKRSEKGRIIVSRMFNGYEYCCTSKNNVHKKIKTHRLVAKTFIPNPENKPFVNHINGIKTDNRAENLEWCTAGENIQHAYDTGLMPKGEKAANAKLTDLQVLEIRECKGLNYNEIGNKFGISCSYASKIIRNICR